MNQSMVRSAEPGISVISASIWSTHSGENGAEFDLVAMLPMECRFLVVVARDRAPATGRREVINEQTPRNAAVRSPWQTRFRAGRGKMDLRHTDTTGGTGEVDLAASRQ